MNLRIRPAQKPLQGRVTVPGDKSISHRAAILASLAQGESVIKNFAPGEDCSRTVSCLRQLGAKIMKQENTVIVNGQGFHSYHEPEDVLDVGNSGTTCRLLAGVLAAEPICIVLTGDASLRRRPMSRVVEPLRQMGATILGRRGGQLAPLVVYGGKLQPIRYSLPVASAQVKSAILLAGLSLAGETVLVENVPTRDHTERLISYFGGKLRKRGRALVLSGGLPLQGKGIDVPGDTSSAAFLWGAALIVPGSRITTLQVGLNPTRTGLIDTLLQAGARLMVEMQGESGGEPWGSVTVEHSPLRNVEIAGPTIPTMIDELPLLAAISTITEGTTIISNARELALKESNRLQAMADGLQRMGADIQALEDGWVIRGVRQLRGATVSSYDDHRIAMALSIAALAADGETIVENADCISVSYPGFVETMNALGADMAWFAAEEDCQ